ncbi:hypothetical protein [Actinoalloteichus caeruleus]|uniref:hypothetical protein n=1 Tax=Actinoalloteichus cyanogriseus TaxID=2893586 RepID=UPI003AB06AC1
MLAAAMPGVQHSRQSWPDEQDEHSLVDAETGSAVRIIITWDRRQGRARPCIAEIGTRNLWDELVVVLGEWERNSRTIPPHWQARAQREALPTSEKAEFQLGGAHLQNGRVEDGIHDPRHTSSFALPVPRQLPTPPVAVLELDLRVRDELDAAAAEQEPGIVALLVGNQGVTNAVALDWIHSSSAATGPDGRRIRRAAPRTQDAGGRPRSRNHAGHPTPTKPSSEPPALARTPVHPYTRNVPAGVFWPPDPPGHAGRGNRRRMMSPPAEVADDGADAVLRSYEQLALHHGIPLEDVLLMAVNLHGVRGDRPRNRARLSLRLVREPNTPWMVIVPLNSMNSPFRLIGQELKLGSVLIAHVTRIEGDDAVGGYFRAGGRAVTLNPNARSRCTGCAFCPNTLEAAADPRLTEETKLTALLESLALTSPTGSLDTVEVVTESTGCYQLEEAAVKHLLDLRRVLTAMGLGPHIGFLTSVVRSDDAFRTLAEQVAPFTLWLTIECFTRRDLLLKDTKADLTPQQMPDLLARTRSAGLDASFNLVVGLDPLDQLIDGVRRLASHLSDFPNLQVYQAHTPLMSSLRATGANELEFYLYARTRLEPVLSSTGLTPVRWHCYRPLWHYEFAGHPLTGPTV